jgi:phage terminase small subunit
MTFVAEVAAGNCSATEAAIRAGYSAKTASSQSSQLLNNPKIKAELDRIQAKAVVQAIGSKAECLDIIWQTMCEARDDDDRVNVYRGGELWLKATGNLVEKREITENQTVNIEWQAPIPEDGDEG